MLRIFRSVLLCINGVVAWPSQHSLDQPRHQGQHANGDQAHGITVIRQSVQATEPLKDVRCLATVKQTNDTLRIIKCQAPIAQRPIYAHIEERITADNIRFSVCPLRQPETDGLLQGVNCDKSTATSKHAFAPPPLRQVIHTLY